MVVVFDYSVRVMDLITSNRMSIVFTTYDGRFIKRLVNRNDKVYYAGNLRNKKHIEDLIGIEMEEKKDYLLDFQDLVLIVSMDKVIRVNLRHKEDKILKILRR